MAPKVKGKAIDVESYTKGGMSNIFRQLVPYSNPQQMLDGNMWRYISRAQPVISDCIATLTMYIQGLPWDIRAKDADKQDELKEEIERHKDILEDAQDGAGFDIYLDLLIQDFNMIPFGGATETIRYSRDKSLYAIKSIDGATLFPHNNLNTPVFQSIPEVRKEPVFFTKEELVRMYQFPRPELIRYGWGMAAPERIYLALELLNRGDKYYANLLLDTPEAGLLDLGDMSKDSAEKWLESFKNLFTGIDAFKIPVLFEHNVPAKYIPFGRPPTDLTFNDTTFKYAQLVCAGFGLTPGDIGMKASNGSLSSDIRDERHSKATGKAYLKRKIEKHINRFLPKELTFWFIDTDDELLVSKGRARSANAVAMRNFIESGTLTPNEARKQLKADGLVTIPLPETPNPEEFEIVKEINGMNDQTRIAEQQLKIQEQAAKNVGTGAGLNKKGGQAGFSLNKRRNVRGGKLESVQGKEPKPASSGGQGEIKSLVEDNNELQVILQKEFQDLKNRMNEPRVKRLVKSAIGKTDILLKSINTDDYKEWSEVYKNVLFERELDVDEVVTKSVKSLLTDLEDFYNKDRWWEMTFDFAEVENVLIRSYLEGLISSADDIQNALYENGFIDNLDAIDPITFELQNSEILKSITNRVSNLLGTLNDGTKYYLTRFVVSSILDVFDSYKSSENIEEVVKSEQFINSVSNEFINNFVQLLDERVKVISDFEINKSFNTGVLKQYKSVGIKNKYVVHNTFDLPCDICIKNINAGEVELDFEYDDKFNGVTKTSPFHPDCHCELKFSEDDLKFVNNNYFRG